MIDGQPGTESKDGPLTPQTTDQTRATTTDEPLAAAEAEAAGAHPTSMLQISPKCQVVLIGGVFILINVVVMVLFVVALILRH